MARTADTPALVNYLITSLVEHPEDVTIERGGTDERAIYEIALHPDDVGKVIGRQGRVIKAIRTLVRASASIDGNDATVEVLG